MKKEIKKPDTRRFYAERDSIPDLGLWNVWGDRKQPVARYICTANSGVVAKRIANALNIYEPKQYRNRIARRFFAEPCEIGLEMWDVRECHEIDARRYVCTAHIESVARRIANALNIYVPKKKRRKKAAHA